MSYQSLVQSLTLPFDQIPMGWDDIRVLSTPDAEFPHTEEARVGGLLTTLLTQHPTERHWSPYTSPIPYRLKKLPCKGCVRHDPGDHDRDLPFFPCGVIEGDRTPHDAPYNAETAHALLLVTLLKWPEGLAKPNLMSLTNHGGWRGTYVFSEAVYADEYRQIICGTLEHLANSLNPWIDPVGKIDDKPKDEFRLWKAPFVTLPNGLNTFDRPLYLLSTEPVDPTVLPHKPEDPKHEYTPPELTPLERIRQKMREASGAKTPEDRAALWIQNIQSIQGQSGRTEAFRVATTLTRRFALPLDRAFLVMSQWNRTNAEPRWSDEEMTSLLEGAQEMQSVPWGDLLDGDSR